MSWTLDDTLTFILRVDKASTPAQIAEVVIDVAQPLGFSHVLAGSTGFSLASEREDVPPMLRGQLQMIATYAFARALALKHRPPPVSLTQREMDVLQWMAEGKSDWEIGVILNVSEHLVDKVARKLRAKLNATNRTQIVALALRHNIIR
jgi:LuxR family quorum sensing-dependent transcriptional regulator